jgi:nucleotide-binding universal stress UspA family protein
LTTRKNAPPSVDIDRAVVCGVDFSERSSQAANIAAGLATALDAPLLLVHVDEGRRGHAPSRRGRGTPQEALHREAVRLSRQDLRIVEELHAGRPDEVLVERARACKARLLVVSSLGSRHGTGWTLGSVSERTAQSSPVPTLVVRTDAAFEAWLARQQPLRIVVAFDFTVTAEAAVEWVRQLRAAGPCDVTVAYSNSPPEWQERLGVGVARARTRGDNVPGVQEVLERELHDRIALLLGEAGVRVRVEPSHGDVAQRIMESAAAARADLIVTGARQVQGVTRLWHTSVSRELLHHARESVAVVPMAAATTRLPPIPTIRRVLVPIDFAPEANRALAHALSVVQPGGVVRLVHVVHPGAIARGQFEAGAHTSRRHTVYVQTLGRRLQDLLPPEADARGILTEARVVESDDAAKGISQEAERFGADVIVIASKGLSGMQRMVMGSVAQALLTHSTRPVFVIRLPAE